jgi:DNA-binding MarR family transcriptional regulator
MMKLMGNMTISDQEMRFNNTEMRLIGQILAFRYVGKRLISTQLAQLLGITRSAVSQIVNRMEKVGVLRRVPDSVDRKIAYIELTEDALETYKEDLAVCKVFIGRTVEKYGKEKFNRMVENFVEFFSMLNEEKSDVVQKRKYTKE